PELDDGFVELSLLEVLLAASQGLLLLALGTLATTRPRPERERDQEQRSQLLHGFPRSSQNHSSRLFVALEQTCIRLLGPNGLGPRFHLCRFVLPMHLAEQCGVGVEARGEFGCLRTSELLLNGQRALEERFSLGVLALRL